jgi:hypothetical protein
MRKTLRQRINKNNKIIFLTLKPKGSVTTALKI